MFLLRSYSNLYLVSLVYDNVTRSPPYYPWSLSRYIYTLILTFDSSKWSGLSGKPVPPFLNFYYDPKEETVEGKKSFPSGLIKITREGHSVHKTICRFNSAQE